jgi:hypothetical protein
MFLSLLYVIFQSIFSTPKLIHVLLEVRTKQRSHRGCFQ